MTDPTGRYFISYKRSGAPPYGRPGGNEEALRLRDALRDRGAPTWRDLDDLAPAPTEDELIQTLNDPALAGAVMILTPQVAHSPVVRYVEAPALFNRLAKNDGFILKIVLVGVEYSEADAILDHAGALQAAGRYNLHKVAGDVMSDADARGIAGEMLKARLAAIADKKGGAPFTAGIFSRRSPGAAGFDVRHDVTPYFDGRDAGPDAYEIIHAAFYDAASRLAATGDRIPLIASGNAALPIGVLYGAIHAPFVFDLSWRQAAPGFPEELWSISKIPSAIRLDIPSAKKGDPASQDIVLCVSVNADVDYAVAEYLAAADLEPRAAASVKLAGGPLKRGQTISAEDGLAIARASVDTARKLKTDLYMRRARLHLFLACPLSLAVLIGQDLNTFAECILYEHDSERNPSYREVHRFNPSSFTYKI